MSRGPGRIERAIRALFDPHPDLAFTTADLVRRCFPGVAPIERKHEVSVLRAARHVIASDPDWRSSRSSFGDAFFNHGNLQSYALARIAGWGDRIKNVHVGKGQPLPEGARQNGEGSRWIYGWFPDDPQAPCARIRALVFELHKPENQARIAPGGSWFRDVRQHCAERDGDAALAAELKAESDRASALYMNAIKRCLNTDVAIEATLNQAGDNNCCQRHAGMMLATVNPADIATRLRALMVQNDPDVVRAGLAEIADALDGRQQP